MGCDVDDDDDRGWTIDYLFRGPYTGVLLSFQ